MSSEPEQLQRIGSVCKVARPEGGFSKSQEGSVCLDSDGEGGKDRQGLAAVTSGCHALSPSSIYAALRKDHTGAVFNGCSTSAGSVEGGGIGASQIMLRTAKMEGSQPSHREPREGQKGESEKCCSFTVLRDKVLCNPWLSKLTGTLELQPLEC